MHYSMLIGNSEHEGMHYVFHNNKEIYHGL